MNKEEMITKLTELQEKLSSEVDSYELENRVEEIENISAEIEKNNVEIKYLSEKIADEKNYVDKKPLQFYLMLEAKELENLRSKKTTERDNEAQIVSEEVVIENALATIVTGEEEKKELEQKNVALNIAIRRARINSENEKIAEYEANISNNKARINDIVEQKKELEIDIEEHKNVIESLKELGENLKAQTEEAQAKFEEVSNLEKEMRNGGIDYASKSADEEQLVVLKGLNEELYKRSTFISYDFAGELKQIIDDYRNNTINDSELKAKLNDLKTRLPENFLKADEAERNKELELNHVTQESLETNIEIIKNQLADEENFKLSPAHYAQSRAKMIAMESYIKEYDDEKASLISEKDAIARDREEYASIIDLCNDDNESIARSLILNNGVDKDLEKSLVEKQKINFETIAQAQLMLDSIERTIEENEIIVEQVEKRRSIASNILDSYNARYSNENVRDDSKFRLVQIDLQKKESALRALKNREAFLKNSVSYSFNRIIESIPTLEETKEENIELPFPVEDGIDISELQPTEENKMEPQAIGTVSEEKEETPIESEVVNSDISTEKEEASFDGEGISDDEIDLLDIQNFDMPKVEDKIEDDKFEVIDYEEDENLKQKAQVDEFKRKFKKHFKKLLYVAAVVCLIVGIKGCTQNKAERAMDAIQNDDSAMDNIIDNEDQQKSVEDILREKGVSLDEEENSTEKSDKTSKDEKDKSLSDYKNGLVNPVIDDKNLITPTPNPTKVDDGVSGSRPAYTETIPSESVTPAPPVDPSKIVDEHPSQEKPHTDPVDPSKIVDPNPDETPSITPTPDEGYKEEVTGPTGDEEVDEELWDNEQPIIENEQTVIEEYGQPVIEEDSVPIIDESAPVVEAPVLKSVKISKTPVAPVEAETPEVKDTTTTINLNEGEAFILKKDDTNYVARNDSNLSEQENEKDIFANDGVNSVSIATDEDGKDTISIEINNSEIERENKLTDSDIESIQEENNVSQDEIAELEAQYKAQQEALKALKEQVQEPVLEEVNEQTLTK